MSFSQSQSYNLCVDYWRFISLETESCGLKNDLVIIQPKGIEKQDPGVFEKHILLV